MAHQRREDWASQHSWQTAPPVAPGHRSAGSWIGLEQPEQEGMAVRLGIFDFNHGGPVGHGRVVGGFAGFAQLCIGNPLPASGYFPRNKAVAVCIPREWVAIQDVFN